MTTVLNPNSDVDISHSSLQTQFTINPDDGEAYTRMRFVRHECNEKVIWWPVLLFKNIHDLLSIIPTDEIMLRTKILCDTHLKPSGVVAFLLGTNRPQNLNVICVPAAQIEHDLKDFYDNAYLLEAQYEKDTSWNEAYQEATVMLEDSVESELEIQKPTVPGAINEKENFVSVKAEYIDYGSEIAMEKATIRELINEKEEFVSVKDKDRKIYNIPCSSSEVRRKQRPFDIGKKSCKDNTAKKITAKPNRKYLYPTRSIPRGTDTSTRSLRRNPPCTIKAAMNEEIKSSPYRPSVPLSPSSSSTISSNHCKDCSTYSHKDSKLGNLGWSCAWKILCNRYGWKCHQQKSKLHPYYYIKPEFSHFTIEQVTEELRKDKDYFVDLNTLQQHIKHHYEWKGQFSCGETSEESKFGSDDDEKKVKGKWHQVAKENMTKVQIKTEKEKRKKCLSTEKVKSQVEIDCKEINNACKVNFLSNLLDKSTSGRKEATKSKADLHSKINEIRVQEESRVKKEKSQTKIGCKDINEECDDVSATIPLIKATSNKKKGAESNNVKGRCQRTTERKKGKTDSPAKLRLAQGNEEIRNKL